MPVYDDRYGSTYARRRRPDPRLAAVIAEALGGSRSVVNVGAGTGNYEPVGPDVSVVAVEPSPVMRAQRPPQAAPVVSAVAERLPFGDGAFDAALAILTLHHWTDRDAGLAEIRRVARRRAVVLTWDPDPPEQLWLVEQYLPGIRVRDLRAFPTMDELGAALGGTVAVESWPVPRDCVEGFLGAYWGRPESYLQPDVRSGISSFHDGEPGSFDTGLDRLAADLRSGAWDARWGHLRTAAELDVGYRIVVAEY